MFLLTDIKSGCETLFLLTILTFSKSEANHFPLEDQKHSQMVYYIKTDPSTNICENAAACNSDVISKRYLENRVFRGLQDFRNSQTSNELKTDTNVRRRTGLAFQRLCRFRFLSFKKRLQKQKMIQQDLSEYFQPKHFKCRWKRTAQRETDELSWPSEGHLRKNYLVPQSAAIQKDETFSVKNSLLDKTAAESLQLSPLFIKPVSSIILSAQNILPMNFSAFSPFDILQYHFRVLNVDVGVIERISLKSAPNGSHFNTWIETREFSGHDVDSGHVRYTGNIVQSPDPSATVTERIVLHVVDTGLRGQATLFLQIHFIRIKLKIVANGPLFVFRQPKTTLHGALKVVDGSTSVITKWNLHTTVTPFDGPENIFYTISKMPRHGHLFLRKHQKNITRTYLGVGSVFRQSDINSENLFYTFRRVLTDKALRERHFAHGLVHVNDLFRFFVHVRSYRDPKEYTFSVEIMSIINKSILHKALENLPKAVNQLRFVDERGLLEFNHKMFGVPDTHCWKFSEDYELSADAAVSLKVPTFEYLIHIVSQPKHGHLYMKHEIKLSYSEEDNDVVSTECVFCRQSVNILPLSLITKGQLIYESFDSAELKDEFQFRILCQDTQSLFVNASANALPERLELLRQITDNIPSMGESVFGIYHLQLKPSERRLSEPRDYQFKAELLPSGFVKLQVRDGLDEGEVTYRNSFLLACPPQVNQGDCSSGVFENRISGKLLGSLPLRDLNNDNIQFKLLSTGEGCINCLVTNGTSFRTPKIIFSHSQPTIRMKYPEFITVRQNGKTDIFFEIHTNLQIRPEDINIRLKRKLQGGCLNVDRKSQPSPLNFTYASILRRSVSYHQCRRKVTRKFSIFETVSMADLMLPASGFLAHNFDYLNLEVFTEVEWFQWREDITIPVHAFLKDLSPVQFLTPPSFANASFLEKLETIVNDISVNWEKPIFATLHMTQSEVPLASIYEMSKLQTFFRDDFIYEVKRKPSKGSLRITFGRFTVDNISKYTQEDVRLKRVAYVRQQEYPEDLLENLWSENIFDFFEIEKWPMNPFEPGPHSLIQVNVMDVGQKLYLSVSSSSILYVY